MADLDAIAQRPAEYLAETGVPQLSGGLIFFSLGSSILIQRLLPRTPLYMLAVPYTGTCCAIRRAVGDRGDQAQNGLPARRLCRASRSLAAIAVSTSGCAVRCCDMGFRTRRSRASIRFPGKPTGLAGLCDSVCSHLPFCQPATEKRFTDIFRSLSGLLGSAALVVAGKHL